jgi:glutamyl-tRNA reductase
VSLLIEGVSHRVAPLDVRERLFIDGEGLRGWLTTIGAAPGLNGAAILCTCGRTEFYLMADDPEVARAEVRRLLAEIDALDAWLGHAYSLDQEAAIAHLFRVPAGLDSVVIGESQILGQFKAAMADAREAMSLDPGLEFLMQRAVNVAKRVRSETEIGRRPVGFGQAAVVQAQAKLGDLTGRSALIVGAGKMAGATARSLAAAGVGRLFFSNRTRERAATLAAEMPARVPTVAISHADIEEAAVESDLIVTSSSSPDHIIGRPMAERLMAQRGGRPLFLLDLAVPRDVSPDVVEVVGVHLSNIDDLGAATQAAFAGRWEDMPVAEAIVADEVGRARADLGQRRADPAITALVAAVEARRQRLLRSVPASLTPDQQDEIDRVTRAITARLLHDPILYLRDSARDPAALDRARRMLGLGEAEEVE